MFCFVYVYGPLSGFELATQWSEAQHATAGLRRPHGPTRVNRKSTTSRHDVSTRQNGVAKDNNNK